jgi:hypothetical protein
VKYELKALIDTVLKELQLKKQPIFFTVDNWIDVDLYFPNQKKIINTIELIQNACSDHNYEIISVDGRFEAKESGSGIFIIVKINNVCCKFNFFL